MGDKTFNQVEIKPKMTSRHYTRPPWSYLYIDKVLLPTPSKIPHSRRLIHTTTSMEHCIDKGKHINIHKQCKIHHQRKACSLKRNKNNCHSYKACMAKIPTVKKRRTNATTYITRKLNKIRISTSIFNQIFGWLWLLAASLLSWEQ